MADKTDKNVAGIYTDDVLDSISFKLHSNSGHEVVFNVWEDIDHVYHVFAETDSYTEDFLEEYGDDYSLWDYRKEVEHIPTANSRSLSLINSFIEGQTYNSIRPLIEDESSWLQLNEEELDKD